MKRSNRLLVFFFLIHSIFLCAQDSTSLELLPVEIRAERSYSLSNISLSRSDFLSAPASFDDPSRLLMKYPGFSVSNDQNNAIIYDGLPSHYSTWSLYGANIANPNHLSDAGTSNDRPSRSAGGVNMFSGQVIGGLDYHTGVDGPAHGIGGVANMSMRSPYQNSVTANISLIGLEAGVDRVFDNGNASLLTNYRYSTVGLLDKLGVELGDEIINYQDIITEYKKKWNSKEIRATVIYGKSSNSHVSTKLQGDQDAVFKDIQDVIYDANNLTSAIHLKADSYQLTLAYSSRDESKDSRYILDEDTESIRTSIMEDVFSIYLLKNIQVKNISFDFKLNSSFYNQKSRSTNSRDYFNFGQFINSGYYLRSIFFIEKYFDLRPAIVANYKLNDNHKLELSTQLFYNSYNKKTIPLMHIGYHASMKGWSVQLDVGKNAQMQTPEILGVIYNGFTIDNYANQSLPPIESIYGNVSVNYKNVGLRLAVKEVSDVTGNVRNDLMSLNAISAIPIEMKDQFSDVIIGSASVFGKMNIGEYNVNSTLTLMDVMSNGDYKQIPYNFGNKWNISIDRKFKVGENKALRAVMAFTHRNGYYQDVINISESRKQHVTVYGSDFNIPSTITRLGNYQRLDLRISYIKKGKWKNVISLDIQNVLNRQNDAYNYFDPLLDEVQLQKQLGLIPILSWRVII